MSVACQSKMSFVRLLTAESQVNQKIYILLENFYTLLKSDNWIKNYIFWELELFEILGYYLDFKNLVDKKIVGDKLQYFSKSQIKKKVIPNFLIEKSLNDEDLSILLEGLKLVGDYLDKTILKPNNLLQPINRLQFINSLK